MPIRRRRQRTVSASEFKTRCLQLMDEVNQSREEIVVTKHGKPIAKLVPYASEPSSIFGHIPGPVTYDDVITPLGEQWDADAE